MGLKGLLFMFQNYLDLHTPPVSKGDLAMINLDCMPSDKLSCVMLRLSGCLQLAVDPPPFQILAPRNPTVTIRNMEKWALTELPQHNHKWPI